MKRLKNFSKEYKNEFVILGALFIVIILIEVFINREFLYTKIIKLEERHYSVTDGALYQFNLENEKLIAQNNDPNVTFDDVNLPVSTISINCTNSMSGAIGQVFYRSSGEVFSEARSVKYDASLHAPILLHLNNGFPKVVTVSSLRLDLTNISNDTITCSDIVVNYHVPFILNTARLMIYFEVMLVLVLFVFRKVRVFSVSQTNYKREIVGFLLIEIFQFIVFKLMGIPINDQLVFLKTAIITCVSLCLSFTFSYIDFGRFIHLDAGSRRNNLRLLFLFLILIVVSYFPIITGKYFYHDDYLNYTGIYQHIFPFTISTGRIGAGLYVELLYKLTVETSPYGRAIAVAGILLIFLLFNKWMEEIGFGEKISLVLPFLCSVSLPFLNIAAYVMEFSFIWGGLFLVLSVILFIKSMDFFAAKKLTDFLIYILMSLISILLSLFIYQATSTGGLALLIAYLLSHKKDHSQILARTAMYYFYFGIVAVLYLFLNKFLWAIYHISPYSRSKLISSFPEVFEKVKWFLTVVIPQSVKQLLFIFGGKFILPQGSPLAGMGYRNLIMGNILQISFCIIIILGCVFFLQSFTKGRKVLWPSLLLILLLSLSLPYSYFYFLVAAESSYVSFYVSGLVATLLVILGICATKILQHLIKNAKNMNRFFVFIVVPALILISLNNNRYLYTTWVRSNDFNFYYVKKLLQNSDLESGRIHIIGSTGEVDIYWIKAARLALLELGKSPNSYNISYSDSEYLIDQIEASRFDSLSQFLTQEEMDFLRSYYIYNSSFGYYYLKSSNIKQGNLEMLRAIFQKVDLIPTEEDRALIIDMRKIK